MIKVQATPAGGEEIEVVCELDGSLEELAHETDRSRLFLLSNRLTAVFLYGTLGMVIFPGRFSPSRGLGRLPLWPRPSPWSCSRWASPWLLATPCPPCGT